MEEFKMIRGKKQTARCKNVGPYGSPLYCDCGCQTPRAEDLDYNITNVIIEHHEVDGYFDKNPWKIIRGSKVVGHISFAQSYIFLDGNEYLGVQETSSLYGLIDQMIEIRDIIKDQKITVTAGSTLIETAAQEATAEKIELMEMDDRNKTNPGYCTNCHSYCFGDCEAN